MQRLPSTYVKGFHHDEAVKMMKYSCLGKTGMEVSQLGFGGSPFGGGYHSITEEDAISSVKVALTEGINYIDTAPWYGNGKSEEMLGTALKDIPREAFYIATKVGRYKPEIKEMFDFSAEKVLSGFEESLKKLGLTYVDIIQVHDLEFAPNPEIILNETLPALQKLRESGKAKFIGITGYPLDQLKNIYERSTVKIDTMLSYCHLTLNDSSLLEYLDFIKENDIGIINASPLSMGMLTPNGPPIWHPASEELRRAASNAALHCEREGVSMPKLALQYTLSHDDVPMHLVGISSVAEVEKNVNALQEGLTSKEKDILQHILKSYFEPVKEKSWEGKEAAKYWRKLKSL